MMVMAFEVLVGLWTIGLLVGLSKRAGLGHFVRTAIAVLCFEILTQPMWINVFPNSWVYLFKDASWILTLSWTNLILTATLMADQLDRGSERVNFVLTVALASLLGLVQEALLVSIGVRQYPLLLVQQYFRFGYLPGTQLPIEALYYVPVFLTLVIGLARFWSLPGKTESVRRSHP